MTPTLLCLALIASSQATEPPRDHATLHPADATYFGQILDFAAVGQAYGDAPMTRMLRDESLLEFVEQAIGIEIDPSQVDPAVGFQMLLAQLPPAAIAMGVDEMLADARSASISATVGDGAVEALVDGMRHMLASLELEQLASSVERDLAFAATGAQPDIARATVDDPGLAVDPWGRAYALELIEDIGPVLCSLGSDGARGGAGTAADIERPLAGHGADVVMSEGLMDGYLAEIGLQVVIEFDSEVTPRQIMDMVISEAGGAAGEAQGFFVRDVTLGGVDAKALAVSMVEDGVKLNLFLVQNGTTIVLGGFQNGLEHFAASLSQPSLASDPDYRRTMEGLPAASGTPISSTFTRVSQWTLAMDAAKQILDSGALEVFARENPELAQFAPLAGILRGFEFDDRPSISRTTLAADGFVTQTYHHGEGAPCAIMPGGTIERSRFAEVGADAAMVWAADINLSAAYDGLLEMAAAASGTARPELESELVAALGTDPRADLLPHLGTHLTVAMDPVRGIGAPKLMGYLDLHDADRAAAGIDRLFSGMAQVSGGELGATLKPYRKMPLARMDIREFSFVEPSAGIVGNRLVLGLSGVHVKKELRRLADGELEDNEVGDLTRVPLPAGTTSFTYVDWAGIVGAAYDAGRALASLAGGFVDQLPFDPETLPPGSIFTTYLPPMVRTVVPTEDGELTTTHKAVGPEFWLLLEGGAAAAGLLAQQAVPVPMPSDYEEQAWESSWEVEAVALESGNTDLAVVELRTGLEIYRLEHGGTYPASLADLLVPSDNFPRGALDGNPVPTDGWGREFAYAAAEGGSGYTLWSFGANGVDEGGRGDDVAVNER
ncbi:type II secretion system protein GspG [Engelhardtia mirabilis]